MKHENTNDGRDERLNRNDAVPSDDGTDMNMTPDESGAGIGCDSTADTTPKECQMPHPPEPDPAHEPEETDTPHEGDGKEEPTESEQHTQEVEDTFERLTDMLNTRRYVDFRAELDALLPVEIAGMWISARNWMRCCLLKSRTSSPNCRRRGFRQCSSC